MNARRQNLQIAEDAADWLLKLDADQSDATRAAFIEWLKHSPRHVDELLLMSAVVRVAAQGARARRVDIEALIREAAPNVIALEPPDASPEAAGSSAASLRPVSPAHARRRRWTFGLAAAAAVFAVALGAWSWSFLPDTYTTPVGEQRSIKLADGSFIYLNTRSRVQVRFSAQLRAIRLLEGEALFVVARDAARPFRVATDAAVVQAVGTQFNVYRREGATTVSVVEGRVRIAGEGAAPARPAALLSVGEQANVTGDGRIVKQAGANLAHAMAWRQRRLIFQSDTLADIAGEFNRYNRLQIRIEDETAARRRFTAVFNADEPQALLRFLDDDRELRINSADGQVAIGSRPPATR